MKCYINPNWEKKEQFERTGLGAVADPEPHLLSSLSPTEAPGVSRWNTGLSGSQCEAMKGKPERTTLDLQEEENGKILGKHCAASLAPQRHHVHVRNPVEKKALRNVPSSAPFDLS